MMPSSAKHRLALPMFLAVLLVAGLWAPAAAVGREGRAVRGVAEVQPDGTANTQAFELAPDSARPGRGGQLLRRESQSTPAPDGASPGPAPPAPAPNSEPSEPLPEMPDAPAPTPAGNSLSSVDDQLKAFEKEAMAALKSSEKAQQEANALGNPKKDGSAKPKSKPKKTNFNADKEPTALAVQANGKVEMERPLAEAERGFRDVQSALNSQRMPGGADAEPPAVLAAVAEEAFVSTTMEQEMPQPVRPEGGTTTVPWEGQKEHEAEEPAKREEEIKEDGQKEIDQIKKEADGEERREGGAGTQMQAAGKELFDCDEAFNEWKFGWSVAKREWCCRYKQKGCHPVVTEGPMEHEEGHGEDHGPSGEETCEGQGWSQHACLSLGCCYFDYASSICYSAVGEKPCSIVHKVPIPIRERLHERLRSGPSPDDEGHLDEALRHKKEMEEQEHEHEEREEHEEHEEHERQLEEDEKERREHESEEAEHEDHRHEREEEEEDERAVEGARATIIPLPIPAPAPAVPVAVAPAPAPPVVVEEPAPAPLPIIWAPASAPATHTVAVVAPPAPPPAPETVVVEPSPTPGTESVVVEQPAAAPATHRLVVAPAPAPPAVVEEPAPAPAGTPVILITPTPAPHPPMIIAPLGAPFGQEGQAAAPAGTPATIIVHPPTPPPLAPAAPAPAPPPEQPEQPETIIIVPAVPAPTAAPPRPPPPAPAPIIIVPPAPETEAPTPAPVPPPPPAPIVVMPPEAPAPPPPPPPPPAPAPAPVVVVEPGASPGSPPIVQVVTEEPEGAPVPAPVGALVDDEEE